MENVTFAEVLTAARRLTTEEHWKLRLMLDSEIRSREGRKTIEDLAREQGKKPVTFEDLLGPDPEPGEDDGNIDEFLREMRESRDIPSTRSFD